MSPLMGYTSQTKYLKGSRQPERRGFRNVKQPQFVSDRGDRCSFLYQFCCRLWFIYFRFRPSKEKWIGNVLPNRRNAANYLHRFFSLNLFFLLRHWAISNQGLYFLIGTPSPPQSQASVPTPFGSVEGTLSLWEEGVGESQFRRGDRHCCILTMYVQVCCGWIAASILKTELYCLRHYIDATMHLAPLGNVQQYCSVFNFQLVFRRLFLQFTVHCLRTQTDLVRQ